jgi:hypothetical protein
MMRVLAVVATVAVVAIAGMIGHREWRAYQARQALAEEIEYRTNHDQCIEMGKKLRAGETLSDLERKLGDLACDIANRLSKVRVGRLLGD